MDYMSVKQAASLWGISERRVRALCASGKIEGALQNGRRWSIPIASVKPADGRYAQLDLLSQIDEKLRRLNSLRPLTKGEVDHLNEEFAVEYTYNSNAIEGNSLTLRETDLVLRGLTIAQKPLKDHLEAIGHKEAFQFVQSLVVDQVSLSQSVIKDIHYLLLSDKWEDRGKYRQLPVRIMGAVNEPVQPYLILPKMEEVLHSYEESSQPILRKIALFHLVFEGITPLSMRTVARVDC